ncbi:MAG TPA: SMC family ATPase [Kineosporiaceae bacterium]|nr:SMC family ATPase [Kineosporiaceae bacterium]
MRLHRLELVAFGPFADRQRIDFDELSAAGLFLLHGPTGAGKTSVLDAICFALYGRVPGLRGSVNRLRSDHAPAHVAPEVCCEFSVSGRRFEVTRAPEWQRPKKRGTGTVREQAHVVLRERVGADWNPLTNRIDEAADLLQQLIGLGAEQFTKLILLPQGEFAAFLRATAEERRPMLQKLFGTDRFAEVERWFADRRRESEHQVQLANGITARLFARAQQARLDDLDVDPPESPEAAAALVIEWAADARVERGQALLDVRAAETAYERARQQVDAAAEALTQRRRRVELTADLGRLLAQADQQRNRRAALTAAGHARVLAPLLGDLEAAEHRLQAAVERRRRAQSEAERAGQDPDAGTPQRLTALRTELGALTELLSAELDLRQLDDRHRAAEREIEAAERDRADAEAEAVELADRHSRLSSERAQATLIAVTLPDREQDAARATTVARAVLDHERLSTAHKVAEDELRAAIDRHQGAVETVQTLRARRLDGMAAELATGLAAADPCPVCGSCQHPAPAAHRVPPVTEQAQRRAEKAQQSAESERERARGAVQAGAQQLAALLAVTDGKTAESAATELARAQAGVLEARSAGLLAGQLATELDAVADRLSRAQRLRAEAVVTAAAGRENLAGVTARLDDLRVRVTQARGEDADLQTRHRRLTRSLGSLTECSDARQELAQAQERFDRASAVLDRAATEAGFVGRAEATAAVLPEADVEQLGEQVAAHDAQVSRLRALLEEFTDAPAGTAEAGSGQLLAAELELQQLRAVQAQARLTHEYARERHTLAARAVRALTGLAAELDEHATATAPVRGRFAAVESVSRCVEGTGGDNTMRMRLSSYVLAARLEQVAEAASVRLAAMSGGRYLLVHTDGPSRGGARSGLGLAVVDGWTGVQRDPSSLSGGETFCTSLALALGLADVVQAEAGGSVIETLLVDEGFGSLDEETLDEVMDVLDGLRSAGRSVGLISHVRDLRDRIPAQLEVIKTRTGSRLIA